MSELICYLGSQKCGCIVEFISARTQKEAARLVADSIKEGLTMTAAVFADDARVGEMCDKHWEQMKGMPTRKTPEWKRAIHCLEHMREIKIYRSERIAEVIADIDSFTSYKKGEIVIVEREYDDGRYCIGKPLSKQRLEENRNSGSLITTMATTVNVPQAYLRIFPFRLKRLP